MGKFVFVVFSVLDISLLDWKQNIKD